MRIYRHWETPPEVGIDEDVPVGWRVYEIGGTPGDRDYIAFDTLSDTDMRLCYAFKNRVTDGESHDSPSKQAHVSAKECPRCGVYVQKIRRIQNIYGIDVPHATTYNYYFCPVCGEQIFEKKDKEDQENTLNKLLRRVYEKYSQLSPLYETQWIGD